MTSLLLSIERYIRGFLFVMAIHWWADPVEFYTFRRSDQLEYRIASAACEHPSAGHQKFSRICANMAYAFSKCDFLPFPRTAATKMAFLCSKISVDNSTFPHLDC